MAAAPPPWNPPQWNPPTAPPRRRRSWLNPRAIVLALLAVGFGLAAVALYPRSEPPHVMPALLGITLTSVVPMRSVDVGISHDDATRATLLDLVARPDDDLIDQARQVDRSITVVVTTPFAAVVGDDCRDPLEGTILCTEQTDQETVTLTADPVKTGGAASAEFRLLVPDAAGAVQYPLSENDEYATAVLPSFVAFEVSPITPSATYAVPTAFSLTSYDASRFAWSSADAPRTNDSTVTWSGLSATGWPARIVTGTDDAAHSWATTSGFLSGALAGLVGAAVLGLVVELVPARVPREDDR